MSIRAKARSAWSAVLLLAAGLVATPPARADRLDEVRARGVMRVGTTGDYKPFSYRANEGSPIIGLDIELARQLAQMLGVRVEWVVTSWPTLMEDHAANRFDIAMSGVSISAERARAAFFSVPYLRDGKTPITRCEHRSRFQTIAQIDQPGVRVIVNPGGTNEPFARAHLTRATITVWPDNNTIFDRIVAGEVDVMITDAVETRLQQRLRPTLCALHPETPFDVSEKAFLLPRDERWKRAVDEWLQPMVTDGRISGLLEKWLDHPWPRAASAAIDLAPLCRLVSDRLALMPDVARHKWNQRSAIDDPARERQIIAGWGRDAEALGIPPAWAEQFFRAQIEAAKTVQRELFARWQREAVAKFDDAPDLAIVTRPRLDALTPRLLRELALAWPALVDPEQRHRIAMTAATVAPDASEIRAALTTAVTPLTDGRASAVRR